ncbi:hypothetical protein RYX36_007861, partial [Vicia faba]
NQNNLCERESKLNLEIIREFYVNALSSDDGRFEFKTRVQVGDELCEYHNILDRKVGSLLACILEGKIMDVGRLITNELKKVALSGISMGDWTPCQLTYLGLIMGLCKRARVLIPSVDHQVIGGGDL